MINKEEVRIGNYFKCENLYLTVKDIKEDNIIDGMSSIPYRRLEGIPLNDVYFTGFGFLKSENREVEKYYISYIQYYIEIIKENESYKIIKEPVNNFVYL
jgi:hypothetical protein